MQKNIYKILLGLIIVILIVGGWFAIFGIQRAVDVEYEAIQFQKTDTTDASDEVQTTITVTGKLHKKLFKTPLFVGSVTVDLYDFTKTYEMINLNLNKHNEKYYSVLHYHANINGKPEQAFLGLIWVNDNFEEIIIVDTEHIGIEHQYMIITAPAQTLTDAIQMYERLNDK